MIKKTGISDLAVAGGNFANVRLNQRLLEETGATSIFVHPNMGDASTAVGSAIYVYLSDLTRHKKKYVPNTLDHVYLGQDVALENITALAREKGLIVQKSESRQRKWRSCWQMAISSAE